MAGVLTKASTVDCGHGGTVSTEAAGKLTVKGSGVLLEAGVNGKSVSTSCATVTNTNTGAKQCSSVTSITAGPAAKLTVGGKAVLLATLAGGTDGLVGGVPQTLLNGKAQQTTLEAS